MKTSRLVALALAFLASCFVSAQEQASPARQENRPTVEATAKPLTVLGKVSNDGKTFMTDIDSEWAISNADAIKGYEGRRVSVRCYVDSEKGRLRVLSIKKDEGDLKYAAQHGDAAFRR